jgi:MFS family permease
MQISSLKSLRQLWLRVALTFVSQFGSNVFAFGMALYIYAKTDSAISFGINLIVVPLVTVVLSPIVGRVIDSYNHKKIVLVAQIASIFSILSFIVFGQFATGNALLVVSFLLIVCLKVADEFILLTLVSSSINFVLAEHIQKMKSYQQIAANISRILAPIFGGFLFALVNFATFAWIEFASEFVSLILIGLLNFRLVQSASQVTSEEAIEDTSFKASLKWLKTQPYLNGIILLSSVVNAVDTVIMIGLPIIVLSILKMNQESYAFLMSAMVLGELLSSLMIARRKPAQQPLKILLPFCFITTLILLVLGFAPFLDTGNHFLAYGLLLMAAFAIPFIECFYFIPLQVWYTTEIPEKIQGRMFALSGALISFATPIGTLFFSLGYELKVANLMVINLLLILIAVTIKMLLFAYFKFIKKMDFAKAKILK